MKRDLTVVGLAIISVAIAFGYINQANKQAYEKRHHEYFEYFDKEIEKATNLNQIQSLAIRDLIDKVKSQSKDKYGVEEYRTCLYQGGLPTDIEVRDFTISRYESECRDLVKNIK